MPAAARFLDGQHAWEAIRARVLKEKAYVAVAWWGAGMSKLLPLRPGSVLVVRADLRTMKQGQTSPDDLLALVDNDVRIFNLSNLHAKIFAFRKSAFVGSMNASVGSWQGRILEAAVEITARNAVAGARRQVLDWARDKELDKADIDDLKRHYDPQGGGEGWRKKGESVTVTPRRPVAALPRLSILRTERGKWKRHTQDRFDNDSPALIEAAARRNESLRALEWLDDPPRVRADERFLEIETDENGSLWVSAPARLGPVTATKGGQPERLVYLARTKGLRRRSLSAFVTAIGRNSRLHRALVGRGRVVSDPLELERVYGTWGVRA